MPFSSTFAEPSHTPEGIRPRTPWTLEPNDDRSYPDNEPSQLTAIHPDIGLHNNKRQGVIFKITVLTQIKDNANIHHVNLSNRESPRWKN